LFTIKQAARSVGVSEATLRTWERRYGVVAPERTDAGYRLYDPGAIAALTRMRRLIEAGWSASTAARSIVSGQPSLEPGSPPVAAAVGGPSAGAIAQARFLRAASRVDPEGLAASLDRGLSIGSFEYAVESWLFPTLKALGQGWERGEIDIVGEHMASHLVLQRLANAFDAAGTQPRGPKVVVGLPRGSRHELGALAFATAARRLGHHVLYLGPDVPEASWLTAVQTHTARAAVLSVVTTADQAPARATAHTLRAHHPELILACGGSHRSPLSTQAHALPHSIAAAARALDSLLHE
jgi:methanogenic corrinoid protein MtbC1